MKKNNAVIFVASTLVTPVIISFVTWELWPGNWGIGTRIVCLIASSFFLVISVLTIKDIEKFNDKKEISHEISKEEKRENTSNKLQDSYDKMMMSLNLETRINPRIKRNKSIIKMHESGVSQKEISTRMQLSISQVNKIINNK